MKKVVKLMNIMVPMYRNNNNMNVNSGGYKVYTEYITFSFFQKKIYIYIIMKLIYNPILILYIILIEM